MKRQIRTLTLLLGVATFSNPLLAKAHWQHHNNNAISTKPIDETGFTRLFEHESKRISTLKEYKALSKQGAHLLTQKHMRSANRSGNLPLVKWLYKEGVGLFVEAPHNESFKQALQSGDMEVLQWWLKQGISLQHQHAPAFFYTPHIHVAKWALQNGVVPPKDLEERKSIIQSLVFSGNLSMLKWLVNQQNWKIPQMTQDNFWWTGSLQSAAISSGRRSVIEWLEKKGLPFNTSEIQNNILSDAAALGDLDFVKWLYAKGAKINPVYTESVRTDHIFPDPSRALKDETYMGPAAVVPPSRYVTPLLNAIEYNHIDITQWLISKGANVHVKQVDPQFGHSTGQDIDLVTYACWRGYTELAKALKQYVDSETKICKPYARNSQQLFNEIESSYGISKPFYGKESLRVQKRIQTGYPYLLSTDLLHRAVADENLSFIKYLMAKDFPLYTSFDTQAALHTAARTGNRKIIAYFLSLGMDINIENPYHETPLSFAIETGDIDSVRFLIQEGAKVNQAMIYRAKDNGYSQIQEILQTEKDKQRS